MKLGILGLGVIASLIAGCSVDPERAAERRADMIERLFPTPSDREGLFFAFPFESGGVVGKMQIIYYVDDVSEASVLARVGRFCTRQSATRHTGRAMILEDDGTRTLTLPDGTTRIGRSFVLGCEEV